MVQLYAKQVGINFERYRGLIMENPKYQMEDFGLILQVVKKHRTLLKVINYEGDSIGLQ